MNRPPTPDHSAPRDVAAPPPWPETGLPPYGDAAYGDPAYSDPAYGDATYADGAYGDSAYSGTYGAAARPDAPLGDFAAAPASASAPVRPGHGFATPHTAHTPHSTHGPHTAHTTHAPHTAADPGRWQVAADPHHAAEPDLRVVVRQPQARPGTGTDTGTGAASGAYARPEAGSGLRRAAAARIVPGPEQASGAGRPAAERFLPRGGVLAAADCVAGLVGLCTVGPVGAPVVPAVLLCVLLAASRRAGLYRPGLAPAALDEVPAIALGTVLAWGLAAAAAAATTPHGALGWPELLDATALTGCSAVALRTLAHRLHRGRARRAPAPTLVIGAPPAAQHLAAALRAHPEYGLAPVATATPAATGTPVEHDLVAAAFPDPFVTVTETATHAGSQGALEPGAFGATDTSTARTATSHIPAPGPSAAPAAGDMSAVPVRHRLDAEAPARPGPAVRRLPRPQAAPVGPGAVPAPIPQLTATACADIARVAVRDAVRHVVVVGPTGPATDAAVELLAAQGCRIWQVDPDGRRRGGGPAGTGRIEPVHLWGYAYRPLAGGPRARQRGKRALDVVLAGLALAVAAPVLAGCALAVRLADGPGVLFRQERIGLGGRPFTLLKFRSLRPRDERESATLWSVAHDDRTSAVGRLLRRTSLDELPQLWNVLRGDMSMVGPRPERPFYVQKFSAELPGYQDRHRMPAGITGLAQVNGLRGDTSIPDRARFDNHYIESWSLWQDVAILVRTATSLFRFGGS